MESNASENVQLELRDTVNRLGCIEVVASSLRKGEVRLLCRATDEKEWLRVMYMFLQLEVEESWYSFIGKKFFIKEGRPVYGWVLAFEADDMDEMSTNVRRLFSRIMQALNKEEEDMSDVVVGMPWKGNDFEAKVANRVRSALGEK